MEAFNADIALLPAWVQYWMNFIGLVMVVSAVVLLIGKETRLIGAYVVFSTIAAVAIMVWMHSQMGMVRLLGIAHVILWTPFVIYLWRRLRTNPPAKLYTIVMWVLMLTFSAALVFDYYDVFRWLIGERAPIVSAAA